MHFHFCTQVQKGHCHADSGKVVQTRAMWKSKRMSKTRGISFALDTWQQLGEVRSNLTKCTSPNRLLQSNQDKESTLYLAHSLAHPHGPDLRNVSIGMGI